MIAENLQRLGRRFLLMAGMLAACAAVRSTACADAPLDAPRHRVLSCNVRVPLEEDAAAGDGWEARRELCGDVIAKQDGDVICLQECRPVQMEFLKERLPGYEWFGLSNPGTAYSPNNAILFRRDRYELVSAGGFWLSDTPHVAGSKSWDSDAVRHVNWVHLRDRESGRELQVWNTHLDHRGHEARAQGAQLIVDACRAYDATGVPQVLTGDMNAPLAHAAIKAFKAGGFVDSYEAVHGPGDPGHTYHRFLGKRYLASIGGKPKLGRIDWIFVRGAAKAEAAEIIRDGEGDRYPSDHYFMRADVVLE